MSAAAAKSDHTLKPLSDSSVYTIVALFAAIYIGTTLQSGLLASAVPAANLEFFVTHLSFIIPELLVWFLATKGALRLKRYTRTVIDSADGKAFDYVANALLLLVVYTILISMATSVKMLFIHTSYLTEITAITNHIPPIAILATSIFVFIGSRRLNQLVSVGSDGGISRPPIILSVVGLLLVMAVYVGQFYHVALSITDDDGLPHFVFPVGVLLVAYVLPHIITWFLGLFACLNLVHYAHRVDGSIYKMLLRDLYWGLLMVFTCTFIVQVLFVANISTREFNPKLLLIFGTLVVLLTGYHLISRGANQLYKLEK